ncbi:extracellular solute-binding protein [Butyricicoccus sp. Marseille-Q5471]|uniref:extracellular solute-binding protein n=1 Tax=Butyricicoccus sp. Marseille-Q5471 TaxID=3039493 RepID=UPI0024BCB7C3|nr:extracellular solute-binding protein [Butyricicoccus sp. Marseille-Q5471]
MKKSRIFAGFMAAAMMVTALTGCGGGKKDDGVSAERLKTVKVWATGSDNVRQIFESMVKDFNENSDYKDQYQAELNFMLSGTGAQTLPDMLAAAYKANQTNTDYDVIDMGGDDLSKIIDLIGEDAFVKIDTSKIPNSSKVSAKSAVAADYCQPYRGTTVVLAYNSKNVSEPPKTMEELFQWAKDHPGRFAYNTPGTGGAGDSFARTTVYNDLPEEAMTSADQKWTEQWDAGFAKLAELHPSIYQSGGKIVYPNKNQGALDLLSNGEIDMCPMWADMLLSQRAAGTVPDYIKMSTIEPSFTGSVQSMMIPAFGSNVDGAYAFMDYMLTDSTQEMLVKQMAAIPLIDTSGMDMTGYEDLAQLDVSKFRIMSIGELGTAFNERWDNEIGAIG